MVSSAPPSAPHGACCTSATSDKFAATWGIMPKESESPIHSTFFFVADRGSGGPLLHVARLMVTPPSAAVQLYRAS